jgi:hypothetical protein
MPELRVPTEFDTGGVPLHWYEKKQNSWNRRSLLVEWSPANRRWRTRTAVFHDGVLRAGSALPRRRELRMPLGDAYTRMFDASVRSSDLKVACMDFLARPRFPTRRHLTFAARAILGRNAHPEG